MATMHMTSLHSKHLRQSSQVEAQEMEQEEEMQLQLHREEFEQLFKAFSRRPLCTEYNHPTKEDFLHLSNISMFDSDLEHCSTEMFINPQSGKLSTENLLSKQKKLFKSRQPYQMISDEKRTSLLLLYKKIGNLKHVAEYLGINYSTAKSILGTFRKKGQLFRKRRTLDTLSSSTILTLIGSLLSQLPSNARIRWLLREVSYLQDHLQAEECMTPSTSHEYSFDSGSSPRYQSIPVASSHHQDICGSSSRMIRPPNQSLERQLNIDVVYPSQEGSDSGLCATEFVEETKRDIPRIVSVQPQASRLLFVSAHSIVKSHSPLENDGLYDLPSPATTAADDDEDHYYPRDDKQYSRVECPHWLDE